MEIGRPQSPSEIGEVVEFMARLNTLPEHQIGFSDESPDRIAADFAGFGVPVAEAMVLARDDGRLCAVFAFDCDPDVRRAWLYGPFVDRTDWDETADELWSHLQPLLPDFVEEFELFFNLENRQCEGFGTRHGFTPRERDTSILRVDRKHAPNGEAAEALTQASHEQLLDLHDRLFPNTYLPGELLLRGLDENKRVFVVTENGRLLAYLYGEVEPEVGYGGIDYLGVVEDRRGEGHGERLIRSACAWMFSHESLNDITLTVDAGNAAARGLYAKVGFEWLLDARGMRRQREA